MAVFRIGEVPRMLRRMEFLEEAVAGAKEGLMGCGGVISSGNLRGRHSCARTSSDFFHRNTLSYTIHSVD